MCQKCGTIIIKGNMNLVDTADCPHNCVEITESDNQFWCVGCQHLILGFRQETK